MEKLLVIISIIALVAGCSDKGDDSPPDEIEKSPEARIENGKGGGTESKPDSPDIQNNAVSSQRADDAKPIHKSTVTAKAASEDLLFEIDASANAISYVISEDLTTVAYVTRNAGQYCVAVNGKKMGGYDDILATSLVLSEDGKHLAYWAKDILSWRVVWDGNEGLPYDGFRSRSGSAVKRLKKGYKFMVSKRTTLKMSPNGQHIAYHGKQGDESFCVYDGNESSAYDGVSLDSPVLSPDGRRRASKVWLDGKAIVVVDDKEYGPGESHWQEDVLFSPDGERWATLIWRDKEPRVIVDGVEGPAAEEIDNLIFSPDSNHVAYSMCRAGDTWAVMYDGKPGPRYERIWGLHLGAEDSLAYFARRGGSEFLVFNGKEGQPHERAGLNRTFGARATGPAISPSGGHVAYMASDGEGEYVVIDGKKGKLYEGASTPIWSPDGKHTAWVASRLKAQPTPGAESPQSSKEQETEAVIIHDSLEIEPDGRVSYLAFSPDSNHLVWVTAIGEKQCIVIDGKHRKQYEMILTWAKPVFVSPSRVRYLAIDGGSVYMVESNLEP